MIIFSCKPLAFYELTLDASDEVNYNIMFLGLLLNRNMSWKSHVQHLSLLCYAFNQFGPFSNTETLYLVYNPYCKSYLLNGIFLWGYNGESDEILKIHKRVFRIVTKSP